MPNNDSHIYGRRISDGKIVDIFDRNNVPTGDKCGCICTNCGRKLQARNNKGNIRTYFAHQSSYSNCKGESRAHIESKEIIKKEKYLIMEDLGKWKKVQFDKVEVEKKIKPSDYQADLICEKDNNKVIIEIEVTSPISEDKQLYLTKNKITTLIIDLTKSLSKNQFEDIPDNLSQIVLREKINKSWLVNKKLEAKEAAIAKVEKERLKDEKEKERLKLVEAHKKNMLEQKRAEKEAAIAKKKSDELTKKANEKEKRANEKEKRDIEIYKKKFLAEFKNSERILINRFQDVYEGDVNIYINHFLDKWFLRKHPFNANNQLLDIHLIADLSQVIEDAKD